MFFQFFFSNKTKPAVEKLLLRLVSADSFQKNCFNETIQLKYCLPFQYFLSLRLRLFWENPKTDSSIQKRILRLFTKIQKRIMSLLNQNSGKIHQIKSKPKFGFLRFVISAFFLLLLFLFVWGRE